ncbi:hypothetical protein [Nodosilinea sp. E11]|uniref:hypothetical protein n=1 Tax=Nodosilinea sp. E11 TaxID=3037479 RepID=UPI0029345D24|nr:hypothetical protein [Nodosilinea sp. E11]WOD39568.1 hypothetical protein RRF56_25505 [Nodosilinea sp. E11]
MTINLTICADVVDIQNDTPRPSDVLLVDTNVWLWQTYGLPPEPDRNRARRDEQKLRVYTRYLNAALVCGVRLKYCGLILAEIAHIIERSEFEIFKRSNKIEALKPKEYRHNYPHVHALVAGIVWNAWNQITMLASSADLTIDEKLANTVADHFQEIALDGYDLFFLQAIRNTGVKPVQVLTDDMDYASVPGIQLFTSNRLVIKQARDQGRLLSSR